MQLHRRKRNEAPNRELQSAASSQLPQGVCAMHRHQRQPPPLSGQGTVGAARVRWKSHLLIATTGSRERTEDSQHHQHHRLWGVGVQTRAQNSGKMPKAMQTESMDPIHKIVLGTQHGERGLLTMAKERSADRYQRRAEWPGGQSPLLQQPQ